MAAARIEVHTPIQHVGHVRAGHPTCSDQQLQAQDACEGWGRGDEGKRVGKRLGARARGTAGPAHNGPGVLQYLV